MAGKKIAKPKPLVFHYKVTVPQDTVEAQQNAPTSDQLLADLQPGLDGDTSLPPGTTITACQPE